MLADYVRAQRTPLTFEAAVSAMRTALTHRLRWSPALHVLALALARTAFETARWQEIWNHNWGNTKATETYEGSYCSYACSEVLSAGLTWFIPEGELDRKDGTVVGKVWLVPPGHPQTRFCAHASAVDGAIRYLDLMSSEAHRATWEMFLLGDAIAYVRALVAEGYLAKSDATYARGVASLQDEFALRLERLPVSEVFVPTRDEVRALVTPSVEADPPSSERRSSW
jgi:hypothetical protein